jgi:hypothetical protein
MGLVQKAFSDIITFSRSSNATRTGPTGLVEYAPHNLLQRSQEFDNAYWTKQSVTIQPNQATAPDGTVTADLLIVDAVTATHQISALGVVSSSTCAVSIYAKASGVNTFTILDGATASNGATFNLSTGVVTNVGTGIGSMTPVGNGWYRCVSVATTTGFRLYCPSSSSTATGDGVSGIYIWGAQLAVGPLPLDYTPTTSAAVYGPRFDYDPVTLAARGLLIEEQRTNLLTYSDQFDNAAWTKNSATVTANAIAAPDGTVTADKLVESATTAAHYINVTGTLTGSTTYSVSVYAKASERSRIQLAGSGGAWGTNATATFDLSTGTVVASSVWSSASITNVGNGWYRCVATGTTTAVPSSAQYVQIVLIASGTTQSYAGDGTSGLFIWGAQLEAGSFATSYIPTVAATVTRSADVASVNTLSPWFNATEGTLFAEFQKSWTSGASTSPAHLEASSAVQGVMSWVNTDGVNVRQWVGATSTTLGSASLTAPNKTAVAYGSTNAGSLNGLAAVSNAGVVPTGFTALNIGKYQSGYINGYIRRIAFYPRRLTDAELVALSA